MNIYGYDLGYTYDNDNDKLVFHASYEGSKPVICIIIKEVKKDEAYPLYSDWIKYLSAMSEYFFMEEIGQIV